MLSGDGGLSKRVIYNENRSSIGIQWLLGIAFRWRGRGQGVAGAWSLQKRIQILKCRSFVHFDP